MTRTVLWLFLLVSSFAINAQSKSQKEAVKKTIDTFFEALHKGDSTLMATVLHKTLNVQTTKRY